MFLNVLLQKMLNLSHRAKTVGISWENLQGKKS